MLLSISTLKIYINDQTEFLFALQGTHRIILGFRSIKQLHASPLPEIPQN